MRTPAVVERVHRDGCGDDGRVRARQALTSCCRPRPPFVVEVGPERPRTAGRQSHRGGIVRRVGNVSPHLLPTSPTVVPAPEARALAWIHRVTRSVPSEPES